jgi:hypothetical protein
VNAQRILQVVRARARVRRKQEQASPAFTSCSAMRLDISDPTRPQRTAFRNRDEAAGLRRYAGRHNLVCFRSNPFSLMASPKVLMSPQRTPPFSAQAFQEVKSVVVAVQAFGSRSQHFSTHAQPPPVGSGAKIGSPAVTARRDPAAPPQEAWARFRRHC